MAAIYPDYYALLGVDADADRATIRRRYLAAMQSARKHPDLGGAHDEAAQLNEAYAVLRSAPRRQAYDRLYLREIARRAPQPGLATAPDAAAERRRKRRVPYLGMLSLTGRGLPHEIGAQCRDLSREGCSIRTLHALTAGERVRMVFHDDPGCTLMGRVRWRRTAPQRFGPPLYEGGIEFVETDDTRLEALFARLGCVGL